MNELFDQLLIQTKDSVDNLVSAFTTAQTLIVTGVGFLAITWAFTQLIFPRLKKLDDIQDELMKYADDLNRSLDFDAGLNDTSLDSNADDLNSIFLRYEVAHKRAIKITVSGAITFILVSSIMVFISSTNFLLAIFYVVTMVIITIVIIARYPNINKVRSLAFLVHEMGFNPWVIWTLMKPGIALSSPNADFMTGKSDEIEIILSPRVFITGWRYYLQLSTHSDSKVWLLSSGEVKYNKKVSKHFNEYGVKLNYTLSSFKHSKLDVPLREGIREFKTSVVLFVPVFKKEKFNPLHIENYSELREEVRGYSGSPFAINNVAMSMSSAVDVYGSGNKFKAKMGENVITKYNKELFKNLLFAINRNISFDIINKQGNMKAELKTLKFQTIKLLCKFPFVHLRRIAYGKFDSLDQ